LALFIDRTYRSGFYSKSLTNYFIASNQIVKQLRNRQTITNHSARFDDYPASKAVRASLAPPRELPKKQRPTQKISGLLPYVSVAWNYFRTTVWGLCHAQSAGSSTRELLWSPNRFSPLAEPACLPTRAQNSAHLLAYQSFSLKASDSNEFSRLLSTVSPEAHAPATCPE